MIQPMKKYFGIIFLFWSVVACNPSESNQNITAPDSVSSNDHANSNYQLSRIEDSLVVEKIINYIDTSGKFKLTFHQSEAVPVANSSSMYVSHLLIEDSFLRALLLDREIMNWQKRDLFQKYWIDKYCWNVNLILYYTHNRNGFDMLDYSPDDVSKWMIEGRKSDSIFWSNQLIEDRSK